MILLHRFLRSVEVLSWRFCCVAFFANGIGCKNNQGFHSVFLLHHQLSCRVEFCFELISLSVRCFSHVFQSLCEDVDACFQLFHFASMFAPQVVQSCFKMFHSFVVRILEKEDVRSILHSYFIVLFITELYRFSH